MTGDRKDDVLGAKEAGIESVGLRYGFPEKDELENAGADYILEKVEDILPFLNQMVRKQWVVLLFKNSKNIYAK